MAKNKHGFCLSGADEKKLFKKIDENLSKADYIRVCDRVKSSELSEDEKTRVKYISGFMDAIEYLIEKKIVDKFSVPKAMHIHTSLIEERNKAYTALSQQNSLFDFDGADEARQGIWKTRG